MSEVLAHYSMKIIVQIDSTFSEDMNFNLFLLMSATFLTTFPTQYHDVVITNYALNNYSADITCQANQSWPWWDVLGASGDEVELLLLILNLQKGDEQRRAIIVMCVLKIQRLWFCTFLINEYMQSLKQSFKGA